MKFTISPRIQKTVIFNFRVVVVIQKETWAKFSKVYMTKSANFVTPYSKLNKRREALIRGITVYTFYYTSRNRI